MTATTLLFALTVATAPQDVGPQPLPPRFSPSAGTMAVVGATVHPASGPALEGAVILVRRGRITAVGADVEVPDGARVVEAGGMHVMPGLVESHSHMGFKQLFRPETGSNNNELSKRINAETRAIDGLNTRDPGFRVALEAGVTTMNMTPGSRSFASGQAVVVKLRGRTVEEMYLAPGGLKFAMRIRQRNQWDMPVTEIRELLAERLREARTYLDAQEAHRRGERASPPPLDLQLEALGKVLRREWPVGVHAHGVEPMRQAIALKDEFGLDLFIHHADATTELAEELARKEIPVSFGPVLPFLGREDPELGGPVRLAEMGGLVSLHQDHPDGPQYYLRHGAALLVRGGMSELEALRTITLNPARLFRLEDRIGSLEPGKDADFVILDGPPLEWESRVRRVFIDGREVYGAPEEARVGGVSEEGGARIGAANREPSGARPGSGSRAGGRNGGPASQSARGPAVRDLVIRGGEVRTVSGEVHSEGTVVIRGGRIVAVGAERAVDVPEGVDVLDASGMVVTPGFIDARTSVGLEREGAFDPERLVRGPVRVAAHLRDPEVPGVFGMDARQTSVHPWVADGVTTVYVAPAPLNLVGGFGAVVKLLPDRFGAVVDSAAALHVSIGEGPLRAFDAPTTRQGMVAVLRRWIAALGAVARGEPVPVRRAAEEVAIPVPDPVPDELVEVLDGLRPLRIHAHAPDDVATGLRVARELGLRAVVEGATGAHRVAPALAAADASVVVGPSMVGAGGGGAPETYARTAASAYELRLQDVPVALSTDGERGRSVAVEAVVARGHGLTAEAALRSVTLDAARILGVDDRLGSLEAGKDGDVVLWRGDPVGTWGRAEVVVVDGEVVWRR